MNLEITFVSEHYAYVSHLIFDNKYKVVSFGGTTCFRDDDGLCHSILHDIRVNGEVVEKDFFLDKEVTEVRAVVWGGDRDFIAEDVKKVQLFGMKIPGGRTFDCELKKGA